MDLLGNLKVEKAYAKKLIQRFEDLVFEIQKRDNKNMEKILSYAQNIYTCLWIDGTFIVNTIQHLENDVEYFKGLDAKLQTIANKSLQNEYLALRPFLREAVRMGRRFYQDVFSHFIGVQNSISSLLREANQLGYQTFNGEMLWNIRNYSSYKSIEPDGEFIPTIDSEYFYTSEYGYKMIIRIYQDTFHRNKNEFFGVSVCLLEGEYDELLEWPFSKRITLLIINQIDPNLHEEYVSEEFTINRVINLFAKAIDIRGTIRRVDLENPKNGFIVDDCLMIHAKIDDI